MGVDRQPPFVATNSVVVVVHRFFQLWVFVQLTIAALHLNANEEPHSRFMSLRSSVSSHSSHPVQLQESDEATPSLYGWGGLS